MQQQGTIGSPIDDETYDLLQTLTSKLEALETYQKYTMDAQGDARQAIQEIAQQDRQHAERLVALLRDRLNDGGSSGAGMASGSGGSSGGQGMASGAQTNAGQGMSSDSRQTNAGQGMASNQGGTASSGD